MVNLTSKELAVIEDQLSNEQVAIKKYRLYAQTCTDPQLKTKCDEFASTHQRHYDTLLTYLG